MDALPPQPPAPPAVFSGKSEQAHARYWDGAREVVIYVQGQVNTRGDADVEFGADSSLRMEVVSPGQKMVLYWDAKACQVTGTHTGVCSEADRRTVVTVLKQRPPTPVPPKA
ncbi:hypothetical protein ACUHMQ_16305 [Chitinimonas sp. PSY-7]|uniref:hypothetical protein n=1 Tax=Chitinimonas sp. PSY-7 TaxID=3459088 RepID=UPI0040401C8A